MTPEQLAQSIRSVLLDAVAAGDLGLAADAVPQVQVERPRNRDHGDWATNVAMQLAKPAATNPRALAERIATGLRVVDGVASVDVAGPGFINVTLDAGSAGGLAKAAIGIRPTR